MPGSTVFKDASKNSGREIYNRALVRGSGPAGEQLRVERYASQQPGVPGMLLSVFTNPDFAVDASGWTATGGSTITRDAPGQFGRWSAITSGDTLETTLSGTFRKGTVYRLTWEHNSNGNKAVVRFGSATDYAESAVETGVVTMVWIPKTDVTAPKVLFTVPVPSLGDLLIDTFRVEAVRPTLLDRRGQVRTRVTSMSQAINLAVGQQIADKFLQSHTRAPLKGTLDVFGRGVRRYLGDAPVDPAELLLYTAELIHLGDQIDPDLGTIGRDGVIDSVTYYGEDERTEIAIDNTRGNFESAVERYAVVAGSGR